MIDRIAIVGCGPAGLSAAIALHDAGRQVTLFEQFDQPGPVGSGLMLQPTGLAVLERWGLREAAESLGQRIDGMLGRVAPDGKVVLDINYRVLNTKKQPELYGVAIHRAALFDVLFKAVQARDIPIITGKTICASISVPNRKAANGQNQVQLIEQDGAPIEEHFDLAVDASGARSILAQASGLLRKKTQLNYGALWTTVELNDSSFDPHLLEQRYKAASVMVGVLPCGTLPGEHQKLATLFWSIKGADYAAFEAAGLDAWKQQVIEHWPAVETLLEHIEHTNQLTHATYSHHTLSRPYVPGVIFIGDAAHATSPQLGQGANMALLDAMALANAIECADNSAQAATIYAKARRAHVRFFQAASFLLTPFYQSDSYLLPKLRDTLFEPVSKLPMSDKLVTALGSGLLGNPIKTIDKQLARIKRKHIV